MKVGFLDSIFNYADVFETAADTLHEKIANCSVERFTTPHLLKIPVCSKLLFDKGCDAILVFLTALPDDFDEIRLVQEKIIDLEVAEKKFVFFTVVSDSEFKNEERLIELTKERVAIIADALQKVVQAPSELAGNIADNSMTNAMDMFSVPSAETQDPLSSDSAEDAMSSVLGEEEGKSLF
ncbi:hypothetical protein KJ765_00355 [Candidatus Micrarchaeota archaeon]|nr:hypothetical protein [Candidatus Micrarchaeota archaeon]